MTDTPLAPELALSLQADAKEIDAAANRFDAARWRMAKQVNDWYSEHRAMFADKSAYYAECSRIANRACKQKRFADSGETLRRWCEVRMTYDNFGAVEEMISAKGLSFEHLRLAKKVYGDGKVDSPIAALGAALANGWTADEMLYHYSPPEPKARDIVRTFAAWAVNIPKLYRWDAGRAAEFKAALDDIKRRFFA